MKRRAGFAALFVALAVLSILWAVRERSGNEGGRGVSPDVEEAKPAPRDLERTPEGNTETSAKRIAAQAEGRAPPVAIAAVVETGRPSRTFNAHIVDERNQPLQDATMSLDLEGESFRTQSGADGLASFSVPHDLLGRRRWVSVSFSAEARTEVRQQAQLDYEGELFVGEIRLLPAGSIVGRVVDEGGLPVSARLRICEPLGEFAERERELLETLGQGLRTRGPWGSSAEDGTFRVDGVPAGACVVAVSDPGHLYTLSAPVEVAQGPPHDVGTLVLREPDPDQRIDGIVQDAGGAIAQGRPVELWQPGVARNGDPSVETAWSDASGRFRFAVPSFSTYHVVLLAEEQDEEIDRVEDVSPGGEALTLRIPPQRFIDIHVSDKDGTVLNSAGITVFDAESHGLRVSCEQIDPGVWRLELPGRPFYSWVSATGYESERTQVIVPDAAPERLEFQLQRKRGARIHGVISSNGEPVNRARVFAYTPVDRNSRLNTGFATRLQDRPAMISAFTDESGTYELLVQKPLHVTLLVFRDKVVALEHGPIAVGPRDPQRELNFELPSPGAIEGRVLLADGRDPRGMVVGASRGDGEVQGVKLAQDATFRFDNLAPGRWQVRLVTQNTHLLGDRRTSAAQSEPTWDVDLASGEVARRDIDLRREVSCRLLGRVRLAPHGPGSWKCTLRGSRVDVDDVGRFSIEVFGPGEAWLNLWTEYSPSVTLRLWDRLELGPGANPWELDLPTGAIELDGVPAFQRDTQRRGQEPELLRLHWTGAAERRATLKLTSHGGGPLLLRGLPVGQWSVETRCAEDGTPERKWRFLVEGLTLAADEFRSVAFD